MELIEIQRQREQTLIEFLTVELDLALTFVGMAQKHEPGEVRERLFQDARQALQTVRRFGTGIANREALDQIHARAEEVRRLLA